MKAYIKTSLILSFLLSFLLICLSQNHANAQKFLKKLLSSSLVKDGKQLKSVGDYPSAITKFAKSIKRNPENLEAYYQLGLIFEEVLHDYDKAISLYKNVIKLSEGVKPTGNDEELKEFYSLITNTRKSIDRAIKKKFESIEKPKVPVYIMVRPYQRILKEPKLFSTSKYKTTSYASEFKLLEFGNNWYQINVPNTGQGWVNGKNVLKIIQKEKNAIETSPTGKAALYERFADLYPDASLASEAKERADSISYEIAKEEGTINSYTTYLKKYPDSKYSDEVQLKKDELAFEDESFFNNINRLRHWITNNPKSIFIEKARNRIEELTFAQAKYDNNTASLEGYIIDYPEGKFVSEAKQLIEYIKYNHAKFKDTINSYRKYLDEYPHGKYADNATKRIDEKEFSALLNSQDIELLVEHLKDEANKERKSLVKDKIEELYFKKADRADNDAEAIKIHEDYIQKYPEGQYAQEAETRIEELSFNIAAKTDTKDAYRDFIKKYPQSKYNQKAIDSIELLAFNVAKDEDTIKSFEKFLISHPNGKLFQTAKNRIAELAFKESKEVDTIEAYEDFVKEYPNSPLITTAKNIIETKHFENASQKGTVKAYRKYVELYPDGSHLEKALLIIDMLTFKPYDERGSVRSLKKFVNKYPENRYVSEARQKIAKLTLVSDSENLKLGFWMWMAILHIFSIAVITLVILKREEILQKISSFGEKREGHKKEERIIVKESYNKNKLKDEFIQEETKMASETSSTMNSVTNSKPETAIHGNIVTTTCPGCNKMVVPDKFFCTWCEAFIPKPSVGKKAELFGRLFATVIDPFITVTLCIITAMLLKTAGVNFILSFMIANVLHIVLSIRLLRKGMTAGKKLLGIQVVEKFNGNCPGLWRMIIREIVGKCASALVFGLGFFWAIWDKDGQAWHDKIAGTVVVKIP